MSISWEECLAYHALLRHGSTEIHQTLQQLEKPSREWPDRKNETGKGKAMWSCLF